MIQLTPQMRILIAVEPVDFRLGIDGLSRVCREALSSDPYSGAVFVFRRRWAGILDVPKTPFERAVRALAPKRSGGREDSAAARARSASTAGGGQSACDAGGGSMAVGHPERRGVNRADYAATREGTACVWRMRAREAL